MHVCRIFATWCNVSLYLLRISYSSIVAAIEIVFAGINHGDVTTSVNWRSRYRISGQRLYVLIIGTELMWKGLSRDGLNTDGLAERDVGTVAFNRCVRSRESRLRRPISASPIGVPLNRLFCRDLTSANETHSDEIRCENILRINLIY